MRQEFSAGVIVYFVNEHGKREYLLLRPPSGLTDFPKGKIELNEQQKEAALRELKEETGLIVELHEGFAESIDYIFRHRGQLVSKTVVFFVGRAETKDVILSDEHIGYEWCALAAALKKLTYVNAQRIIQTADQFLDHILM
jgi:8-oxo-dGTP pyrophosphatase MutT (NUDIX family)